MEKDRKAISEFFARKKVFHTMKRRGRGRDQVGQFGVMGSPACRWGGSSENLISSFQSLVLNS